MLNIKSIKFVGMGAFIYYNNFFLDGGGECLIERCLFEWGVYLIIWHFSGAFNQEGHWFEW